MKAPFFILLVIIIVGCVSKTSYTELENKCKSLTEEIAELKSEIDELKNGEERLVNLAKNSYNKGDFILTDSYIRRNYLF